MKKAFVAILSLAALVGCSRDVVVDAPASAIIQFGDSFVENKTRVAADPSTTTANIQDFTVWGFRGTDQAEKLQLVFDDQYVSRNGDVWEYTPLQYWLQGEDYFFAAVSPAVYDVNGVANDVIKVTEKLSKQGLGTIEFTNEAGDVDLLYAEKHVYASTINPSDPEEVKLQFAHLLSKVKFTFSHTFYHELTTVAVKNVCITNSPKNGSIDVTADRLDWAWDLGDKGATIETVELEFGNVNGGNAFAAGKDNACESDVRLVIPSDTADELGVKIDFKFDVIIYHNGVEADTFKDVTSSLDVTKQMKDKAFVPGKSYNLVGQINPDTTLGLKPILFTVEEVEDWVLDGNEFPDEPDQPVQLATPSVKADVSGKVVTLTWAAVENAAQYSITVGTEKPVFVEDTTYVFTGEYETEYAYSVVAVPADATKFAASAAFKGEVTTEAQAVTPQPTVTTVTVAEFLALTDVVPSDASKEDIAAAPRYSMTGVITRMYHENNSNDTDYGNFYLKDATGEVLIYGLYDADGNKCWATSGAKIGDTITVQTIRTEYSGSPQGKNATFIKLVPFVAQASEWGVVGDLNEWGKAADVVMYNTWKAENLFVAYNVEIASGAFKIRANNEWNDAKNYGLAQAGSIYADKYYALTNGNSSQDAAPMVYGTYDVYFDLANTRIALMTPGKEYSTAEDGGRPVVVVEGLKEHEWGLVGSFNGWDVANYVVTEVQGDWAVAKNVTLENGAAFKFAADKDWTLSYGAGCEVNIGQTYVTYNNGGNMEFVGETGAYNLYFSLVDASFYMEAYSAAPTDTKGIYESMSFLFAGKTITNASSGETQGTYAYKHVMNADDGTTIDVLKLGTSKAGGSFETDKVGVNGVTKLSFYAVGWKGKKTTLTVTVNGVDTEFALVANDGATGNPPYNSATKLTFNDTDDYYTIDVSGITSDSTISFATDSTGCRAIICGVQLY